MSNRIHENVPFLTPIESNELSFLKIPAYYLWFGGEVAEHIPVPAHDGTRIANKVFKQTSCISTALKIATYILSLGIFPLLALLTLAISRCVYSFNYVRNSNAELTHEVKDQQEKKTQTSLSVSDNLINPSENTTVVQKKAPSEINSPTNAKGNLLLSWHKKRLSGGNNNTDTPYRTPERERVRNLRPSSRRLETLSSTLLNQRPENTSPNNPPQDIDRRIGPDRSSSPIYLNPPQPQSRLSSEEGDSDS
jgi:hypothetical protein